MTVFVDCFYHLTKLSANKRRALISVPFFPDIIAESLKLFLSAYQCFHFLYHVAFCLPVNSKSFDPIASGPISHPVTNLIKSSMAVYPRDDIASVVDKNILAINLYQFCGILAHALVFTIPHLLFPAFYSFLASLRRWHLKSFLYQMIKVSVCGFFCCQTAHFIILD